MTDDLVTGSPARGCLIAIAPAAAVWALILWSAGCVL